ncbi:MAG: hypothetical protein ACREKL_11760, partial [Chthoniobacterales bacterium]
MKTKLSVLLALLLVPAAFAQVPDSETPQQSDPPPQDNQQQSQSDKNQKSDSKFLGKDMPFFDPDNETLTWDGKTASVTNNRVFQARFEKYLNAPAETDKEALEYNALIKQILDLLSPRTVTPNSLDQAFGLLPTAAAYKWDSNMCDTIANQVYSAWQSQKDRARMLAAGRALDDERSRLERNKIITLDHERYSV